MLQGGSPSAEHPAAQADMPAAPAQGMPAAGARDDEDPIDMLSGCSSHALPEGRPVEGARELAAKAAMATVYSGPALFTEVKGAPCAAADAFNRGRPFLKVVHTQVSLCAACNLP